MNYVNTLAPYIYPTAIMFILSLLAWIWWCWRNYGYWLWSHNPTS